MFTALSAMKFLKTNTQKRMGKCEKYRWVWPFLHMQTPLKQHFFSHFQKGKTFIKAALFQDKWFSENAKGLFPFEDYGKKLPPVKYSSLNIPLNDMFDVEILWSLQEGERRRVFLQESTVVYFSCCVEDLKGHERCSLSFVYLEMTIPYLRKKKEKKSSSLISGKIDSIHNI